MGGKYKKNTDVVFHSISVISGRWEGDNERLCAMGPRLRLDIFSLQMGLEIGTGKLQWFNSGLHLKIHSCISI